MKTQKARRIEASKFKFHMHPKRIAIDLTPMLPGGANGGAKIITLELIRNLASVAPHTQFLLLIQNGLQAELKNLERDNIVKKIRVEPKINCMKDLFIQTGRKLFFYVPKLIKERLSNIAVKVFFNLKIKNNIRYLMEMDVDLVFCPFSSPAFIVDKIPTVCVIHDLQHIKFPQFFTIEEIHYRNYLIEKICQKATSIVAISQYTRASIIENNSAVSSKVTAIYHRLGQLSPHVKSSIFYEYFLTPKQYLIYPANFWKHKNHALLIDAFHMAIKRGLPVDIKLVCTGETGGELDLLKEAVSRIGLVEKIIFTGFVEKEDLDILLSNALGMVFPSLYEGFGMPVIEAMSVDIPVACSNVTALPEIVGDAAILFDPISVEEITEAILQITTNTKLREGLVNRGRDRALAFSDSKEMAQEYMELFSNTINKYRAKNSKKEKACTSIR